MTRVARQSPKTWTGFLRVLRETYNRGDPCALASIWAEGRSTLRVGSLIRLVEFFYPVGHVLSVAAELDRRIAQDGLSNASRWLLDTWTGDWRTQVAPSTADVLASSPALIYGNHPSLLTPFLVAANTPRPDLKIISAGFLERLLPSYAPYSLPVVLPTTNWGEQFRRGGLPRVLVAALIHSLQSATPRETAKEANRQAIAGAAAHIRAGGAVLIAPGGWSIRRWPWHPGIGRIVEALSRDPGTAADYLVPFREENSSDARVRAFLGRGPVARLKRELSCHRPVTIRFGPAMLRSDLPPLPEEVPEIVRLLQNRYDDLVRRWDARGRGDRSPRSREGQPGWAR